MNFLRDKKELKYKRSLVDEYGIADYVHYLPRITYTQTYSADEKTIIKGKIKYPENIYEREVPSISLDSEPVELINDTYFEYTIDLDDEREELKFKFELPKQTMTRTYKLKNKRNI